MAKIVFVNIPAHGHTNPTLAVAKTLLEHGHVVLYYSGEEMRGLIESTGAEFHLYPEPMPSSKRIADALYEMINATMIFIELSESKNTWFIDEMRREKPDLIIYDSTCMWGYIAGRLLNIPHICSITTFVLDGLLNYMPFATIVRFILQAIPKLPRILQWKQALTKEFGKENVGGITEYSDCNIVFTSKAFHPENKLLDERFHFVGASLNPNLRSVDFPFENLDGRRLVYISLGTINHLDTAFYHAAFEAFADYPAQFVLSVGKHTDIAHLGDIPSNFIVRNFVPQLEILQRADVFITHGGMNSVHEGLYYGVPEIVVPHQMEQVLNGKRVKEVGAGILLGDKAPYGKVSAKELHDSLDTILGDKSFQEKAKFYGETLKNTGGYEQAVRVIEGYLGIETPELA